MKYLGSILAGLALAATPALVSAETPAERGEARLAKMIEGRAAGEPVSCIPALRSNRLTVIDHVGLVYDAGETIYVARASNPRSLGRNDIVVIDRFGSQLCKQDIVRTVDRYQHYTTGAVFLEDFIPYTKQG